LKDSDRKRIEEIFEERRNKVLNLEKKFLETKNELDAVLKKVSSAGVKGGETFSEYASYRKKLEKELSSLAKKLVEAKEEFKKAEIRLHQINQD
jgi:hypothetical protein